MVDLQTGGGGVHLLNLSADVDRAVHEGLGVGLGQRVDGSRDVSVQPVSLQRAFVALCGEEAAR